ncbi:MAG: polymer-forming cytoskeletal protein [Candidatus Bipolaricaulota bacterium]|nr:polymer-forming cytoskeletal protein [Candidatus Bipolaricaulota bacterium]MCS7274211.1 polymer-forming cytoskeletal protein [Candidatus Bipolaricaulota bacterium]MDW8110623.1 polymer-forming cytoskeletal protein [Candidatus Bipolaricaulota bacterium]MDW8328519.1 polymer-forming cytoskeletal protein [Candidatus Bipolaricaulota bacterium]
MTTKRGNISISGSGRATGGLYEAIKISGSGRIEGAVEAETVTISGAGAIEGDLKAKNVKISGSGKVAGSADVGEMRISGSGKILGDVRGDSLHASGSCHVQGSVRVGELSTSGSVQVGQDVHAQSARFLGFAHVGGQVEVERFYASGAFHVEKLLSADVVEIRLWGRCSAGEIGGGKIDIRKGEARWWFLRWFRGSEHLETDSIEADEIYLEATTAKTVRGKRVTIGPECRIERVEYSESLQINPKSAVKEQVRI